MTDRRDSLINMMKNQAIFVKRPISIVEIGVAAGATMERVLKQDFIGTYVGVDPWKRYLDPPSENFKNGFLDSMVDTLDSSDFENRYISCCKKVIASKKKAGLIRTYSHLASQLIEDTSIDIVFVDGAHQKEYVLQDIINWRPKLKTGGLMIFDDWSQTEANSGISSGLNSEGPFQALNEYRSIHLDVQIFMSDCKNYAFFINP